MSDEAVLTYPWGITVLHLWTEEHIAKYEYIGESPWGILADAFFSGGGGW
jgi:hypothetical protein